MIVVMRLEIAMDISTTAEEKEVEEEQRMYSPDGWQFPKI